MLEIKKVSKTFEDVGVHQVLEDINITAKKGELVCILGPSGCGKTVLLYLVAGFIRPTAGKILIDGKTVENPNTDCIMVFQDYSLLPWLTVYENIMFGLKKNSFSNEQKDVIVREYLDIVGLIKFKDWYPHTLSGGMKQKVAIARALISDPKILLMDEPFAALDSQYRKYMRENLEQIWQKTKKTIVFVTHSVNEAISLADTIYLFSSLPAKIKKEYRVNLSRPRNPRSPEFITIAKDIEKEFEKEFQKSLVENPMAELAMKRILSDAIN